MFKTTRYCCFIILLLVLPGLVRAADVELLKMLEEKGYLTAEEVKQLEDDDSVRVEPSGKHTQKLWVSTLFQLQYNYIEVDNRGGSNPATRNNFLLRRVYLGIEGRLSNGWGAIIMPNLGDGSVRLDHAYFYKKFKNPDINFFAGFRKVRFNFEQYSSTGRLRTVERSLVAGYWGNDTGTEDSVAEGSMANGDQGFAAQHIGIYGNYQIDGNYGMELGISNGYANELPSNAFQNNLGFYYQFRTNWDLAEDDSEAFTIEAGINSGFQPEGNSFWQPTNTGETARTAGTFLIGNTDGNAANIGVNPYFLVNYEDFIITGELLLNWVENGKLYDGAQLASTTAPGSSQAMPMGIIVTPSYRFLDDFEFVFRYSYLDTNGRGALINATLPNAPSIGRAFFNRAQSYYFGFNWYILRNDLKLQLGYQYAEYWERYIATGTDAGTFNGPGASVSSFRTQFQLVF